MKWIIVLIALLVGIGIGIAYQKSRPGPPNTIQIRVGVASQQALVNPQPNDVIKWFSAKGPTTVKWPFGSPCDPNFANECHILGSANKLTYSYECQAGEKCDPDVPIGSDAIVGTQGTGEGSTPLSQPALINLGCISGNIAARPPSPPEASVSASLQGAVVWQGNGPATNNWSIVNGSWKDSGNNVANVCVEPQIGNSQVKCTLVNGLQPGIYSYQATSSACATTPAGTFSVQVSQ